MHNHLARYSLLFLLALFPAHVFSQDDGAAQTGVVKLELSGLSDASGNIYISVYNSEDSWLGADTLVTEKVAIADALEGELVLAELPLPPGEYAISIFYDLNNNGELDTNFIGIPTEQSGSSNNAPARFGPPKFRDAAFVVGSEAIDLAIRLN